MLRIRISHTCHTVFNYSCSFSCRHMSLIPEVCSNSDLFSLHLLLPAVAAAAAATVAVAAAVAAAAAAPPPPDLI